MAENMDLRLTVEAWAEITVKNWLDKIIRLNVIHSRDLFNSFEMHVYSNAGGDVSKIEFAFLYYGKFVDMGVGRGASMGSGRRKAKPWYNKQFGKEIARLRVILGEKYAEKAAFAVVDALDGNAA
jgi:hypothetical protein